jgi:hypothetical protein
MVLRQILVGTLARVLRYLLVRLSPLHFEEGTVNTMSIKVTDATVFGFNPVTSVTDAFGNAFNAAEVTYALGITDGFGTIVFANEANPAAGVIVTPSGLIGEAEVFVTSSIAGVSKETFRGPVTFTIGDPSVFIGGTITL